MLSKEELDAMIRENPFCVINDILYKALYDDIIHLRIQPGEKLSESKIAQTLQISRTPVRNALISLANDNLIERRNGRASVVRPMQKEESKRLYEARIAVEGYAAFLAAQRISAHDLKKIKQLLAQFMSVDITRDRSDYVQYDHEFHSCIVNAAQNPQISKMYACIEKRILHYRYCLYLQIGVNRLRPILMDSYIRHEAIYHALKFRFADTAKSEMERDISGMLDVFGEWM